MATDPRAAFDRLVAALEAHLGAVARDRTDDTPAVVTATISCRVLTADLSLPGIPGTMLVQATQTSPLDTFRER